MVDYDYLYEKFNAAVDILATGKGSIQTRLADACELNLLLFKAEELPEVIRDRVMAVHKRLTNATLTGNDGTFRATVNAMTDDEANQIAGEIISLFDHIKSNTE